MTMYKLHNVLILALAGLLLTWSCFGSLDSQKGWDKDFDAYQIGAYINGEEFHESRNSLLSSRYNYYGFDLSHKDSLIMIRLVTGNRFWMNSKGQTVYDWTIVLVIDESSYIPGSTYFFSDRYADGTHCLLAFGRREFDLFEPLPFVMCYFVNNPFYENRDNPFIVTEGKITIGSFDEYDMNADTIYFDLKAEDKNGNILDIKNGYCKKFYDPDGLWRQ